MKTKFKVGDVVRFKHSPKLRLHIVEVTQQICYANTVQEWYTGRIYSPSRDGIRMYDVPMPHTKLERFSLIELEAVPDVTKERKVLNTRLARVKLKKEAFIKKQDFEAAAKLRVEEQEIKEELERIQ